MAKHHHEELKKVALAKIHDLVTDFLYYDRKEDEELSRIDLENIIEDGTLTYAEIINHFDKYLLEEWPFEEEGE